MGCQSGRRTDRRPYLRFDPRATALPRCPPQASAAAMKENSTSRRTFRVRRVRTLAATPSTSPHTPGDVHRSRFPPAPDRALAPRPAPSVPPTQPIQNLLGISADPHCFHGHELRASPPSSAPRSPHEPAPDGTADPVPSTGLCLDFLTAGHGREAPGGPQTGTRRRTRFDTTLLLRPTLSPIWR